MTKKFSISTTVFSFILILCVLPVKAQFMNFSMEVEPELSVNVIQNLNFGSFIANSGIQRIEPQSPNVGIFEIRAFGNQNVTISLNMPDSLNSNNAAVTDQIPLILRASYSNSENQSVAGSIPIQGNTASFPLGNTNLASTSAEWQHAYIYIFGEVLIGEVSQGEYSASLVLSVEYQ